MLAVKFDHKKLKEKVQMVPKAEPGTKKKKKKKSHGSLSFGELFYLSSIICLPWLILKFHRKNYRLLLILRNFKVTIQISVLLSFETF